MTTKLNGLLIWHFNMFVHFWWGRKLLWFNEVFSLVQQVSSAEMSIYWGFSLSDRQNNDIYILLSVTKKATFNFLLWKVETIMMMERIYFCRCLSITFAWNNLIPPVFHFKHKAIQCALMFLLSFLSKWCQRIINLCLIIKK